MTFDELVDSVKRVKCGQMRAEQENYLEIVVARPLLDTVASLLHNYFGPPMKPEGRDASRAAERCAEPYGGIWRNQTMYMQTVEQGVEAALLWPWNDGENVTVKIIRDDGTW